MGQTLDIGLLRIDVNGKEIETRAASLGELVDEHVAPGVKVATAVNGKFVPASARVSTLLKAGDRIEIVSPRQGG